MLDCNVLILSVLTIKGTAVIKPEEKGCMAMIVCERVSGDIIAFLLVSVKGAQFSPGFLKSFPGGPICCRVYLQP